MSDKIDTEGELIDEALDYVYAGFGLPFMAPLPRGRGMRYDPFGDGDWLIWTPREDILARQAEEMRRDLSEFSDAFDVRVSDDARSAAMCRTCKALLVGDREQRGKLEREILAHLHKGENQCQRSEVNPAA
jgi:hypothetical protein